MKTTRFSLFLTVPLWITAFAFTAFAQSSNIVAPVQPAIIVTGNAQVEAAPDQAVVRIGILHQSASAKDAQEEAAKVGQAILKAVGGLGVPANRIQTSRLTISPMYSQQKPGSNDPPHIAGYRASNAVAVTLDNLALIGRVVDAGLDNGANQLEGVEFQLKNDAAVRQQALKLAVTEAKGKATAIAEALGVTLGAVLELSESGVSISPLRRYAGAEFSISASSRADVATPVSPGQLEISAAVVLRYAIVSKN